METTEKRLLIGKIKDAHGIKGEVLVIIFSKDYSPWLKLKQLNLAPDEKSSTRSIEVLGLRQANLGLIIRLAGVIDRNQAEALRGQLVFVPPESLKSKKGERLFLREILGFQVFDKQNLVGSITGFSSNGPQDILLVQPTDSKAAAPIEIPFVEAFIVDLIESSKTLKMNLPEGLIEVNFSPSSGGNDRDDGDGE